MQQTWTVLQHAGPNHLGLRWLIRRPQLSRSEKKAQRQTWVKKQVGTSHRSPCGEHGLPSVMLALVTSGPHASHNSPCGKIWTAIPIILALVFVLILLVLIVVVAP